ncbi:MAG: SPOR domain-containing protein [Bacteroidota bacterium]
MQKIFEEYLGQMRTFVFSSVLLLSAVCTNAQEGVVTIEQNPKIPQLVKVYNKVNSNRGFYQIQVGFGSYEKAQNLKSQVEIDFPGWYSKIEFQEPTYRVRLGKFEDPLEAERRFREVRKKYPSAMLLKPGSDSR